MRKSYLDFFRRRRYLRRMTSDDPTALATDKLNFGGVGAVTLWWYLDTIHWHLMLTLVLLGAWSGAIGVWSGAIGCSLCYWGVVWCYWV